MPTRRVVTYGRHVLPGKPRRETSSNKPSYAARSPHTTCRADSHATITRFGAQKGDSHCPLFREEAEEIGDCPYLSGEFLKEGLHGYRNPPYRILVQNWRTGVTAASGTVLTGVGA